MLIVVIRRLAWSKIGNIIYMSPDRSGIILRNHVCSPSDGDWRLSKEYPLPDVQKLHEGSLLEHLAWSPSGADLAVVDAMGRVTILDFHETIVCNQMKASRSCLTDQEDDLSAVSGLFWLNPDRQVRSQCERCLESSAPDAHADPRSSRSPGQYSRLTASTSISARPPSLSGHFIPRTNQP